MSYFADGTPLLAPIGDHKGPIAQAVQDIARNGSDIPITATGSITARTAAIRAAEVINVRDYGAIGNGVADDTAALNAARDAAFTSGKPLILPANGIYMTDGLRLKNGMRLIGGNGTGTAVGWLWTNPDRAATLKARSPGVNVIEIDGDADGYTAAVEIAYVNLLGSAGSGSIPTSVAASFTAWATGTHYTVGLRRSTARGDVYECITEGDSAGAGTGPMGFGADITDGTAHWKYVGLGHGIYIHGSAATLGNFGIDIHHVSVGGMPGKGIFAPLQWYTTIGPSVRVDACAEHLIDLSGGVATLVQSVYMHRVAAGKAGIRLHYQGATLMNVNGIDASGAGASWGIFGDTVAEDGVAQSIPVTIIGCNVEAFRAFGVHLKYGSVADIRGTSFINTEANTVALQVDYAGTGMEIGPTVTFSSSGSWANGYAVHLVNAPIICKGAINGLWESASLGNQAWQDTYARAVGLPTIDVSADYLRQTATNIVQNGYLTSWDNGTSAILAHGSRTFNTLTWSASPVADGAISTVDLTFPGALAAQRFTAFFKDQFVPAGIIIQASCTSAGHVAVTILNKTGGDYIPPTGILYVEVWAHQ